MTARPIPEHIREAAVADYHASGESYAAVAARHGISSSRLHSMVNPGGAKKRRPRSWEEDDLAYSGGWEIRGGVRYPLFPERRSA